MTLKAKLAAAVLSSAVLAGAMAPGAKAQPITGLYVGGGAGYNFSEERDISARGRSARYMNSLPASTIGTMRTHDGWLGLLSLGWGFGNGFRAEVEGNYRENDVRGVGGFGGPTATSRFTAIGGTVRQYGVMTNVLFDFDMSSFGTNISPYIGGGVGYLINDFDGFTATRDANSGNRLRITDSEGNFAYQAIAGLSFPIEAVPGLSLTAEYRYLGSLRSSLQGRVVSPIGATVSTGGYRPDNVNNHSGILGLRYAFYTPAPPPAPAPVAVAPAPARTYLVF
ncbi:outer membrane beta-barrel protein, partial [Roseomonas sp. NAR14]|nr:outer membrane beta-barrel protein [Roseomonas acroporae]